ncbi:MAG: hypothetical protein HY343_10875, partial [Lentisphaerae bacterium]|nr:hypothetical protein [Lentisphaerota bacterium]
GRFFAIGDHTLTAVDAYNGWNWWVRPLPFAPSGHGGVRADGEDVMLSLASAFWRGSTNGAVFLLDPATGRQKKIYAPYAPPPQFALPSSPSWPITFKEKDGEKEGGSVALAKDKDGLVVTLTTDKPLAKMQKEWGVFLDFRPLDQRLGLYDPPVYHYRILVATGETAAVLWRPGKGVDAPPISATAGLPTGSLAQAGLSASGVVTTVKLAWADLPAVLRTTLQAGLKTLGGKEPESFGFAVRLSVFAENKNFPFITRPAQSRGCLFCNPFADGINDGWANVFTKAVPATAPAAPVLLAGKPEDLPAEKRKGRTQNMNSAVRSSLRVHPLTGVPALKSWKTGDGCGGYNLSASSVLRRGAYLSIYDFADDSGVRFIGGVRASCGVSFMAANGIYFAMDGGAGCDCSYNFLTSVALAPAEERLNEDWAVFSEWRADSQVRQAAINLGAPGDRRDGGGALWLGFPRPALTDTSPNIPGGIGWHNVPGIAQGAKGDGMAMAVPLDIRVAAPDRPSVDGQAGEFGPYRMNADRNRFEGTDRPWIYASGYRGIQQAVMKLNFLKPLLATPVKASLKVDGKLDEADWAGEPAATMEVTKTRVFLRYDADNLYLGVVEPSQVDAKGNVAAWNMSITNRDTPIGLVGNYLELFLSDATDAHSLYLGVTTGGAQYDALSVSNKPYEVRWNAAWSSAVTAGTNAFTTELAIPWKMLADAGLDRQTLALNVQMSSRYNLGEALVGLGGSGRGRCLQFVPVQYDALKPLYARPFTVRLHFAEPDEAVKAGRRVFDVKLQDRVALKDFDIVKEAGGPRKALVKEFKGVTAGDTLTLEFIPRGPLTPETAPILSGLELAGETKK